ncbi:hypothetical protein N836_09665 [Leptolyngbya sp. Heron Island J]|nr:hypothetical protein N836_09665 [Leptolyngbya sp. Heron Island J]
MSWTLAAVLPAQAGILDRFREIFQPGQELKSATGTRRGGGSRDFCEIPISDVVESSMASVPSGTVDETTALRPNALVAFAPWTTEVDPDLGEQEILVEGKTLDAYPSFSLYVPFTRADNQANLEFSISNVETSEYVAEPFALELPETAGVVTIQITDTPIEDTQSETTQFRGLQPDTVYEWTVTLRCNTPESSSSLQSVSGLISLASDTEFSSSDIEDYLEEGMLEAGIWYDMVAQLAVNQEQYPDEWSAVLEYVELNDAVFEASVTSFVVPVAVPVTE